jgi:ATP-dependent helicase YprA (DUF1998 family)
MERVSSKEKEHKSSKKSRSDDDENKDKSHKKRRHSDSDDAEEENGHKNRHSSSSSSSSSSADSSHQRTKKLRIDDSALPKREHMGLVSEDVVRRVRTRSMSDAEEQFRIETNVSAEEFRSTQQITIVGKDVNGTGDYKCPDPFLTFAQCPFSSPVRRALDMAGFSNPTPTQAQSWPIALQGRDIITVAKTGSGKTCGFLLPAFHRLLPELQARKRGVAGILVLAPTRELAVQIEEEAVKFGKTSFLRSVCVYGGAPKSLQIRKIQQGIEILIATPGRLNDLLEMKCVDLSYITFLVLDEADRM